MRFEVERRGCVDLTKEPLEKKLEVLNEIVQKYGEGQTLVIVMDRQEANHVWLSLASSAIDAFM